MNTIVSKQKEFISGSFNNNRRNSGGGFLDVMQSPSPGKLDDTDEDELAAP